MAEESAGQGVVMLSGIREGVPVIWHEAVAVVSGLASWVTDNGPDARVPDLDHVGFSPSGEVFVFPGGKSDPDHVKALASLLLAILADTPAPAPLLELATPRASGAIREPLDAFVTALKFFERPNPAQDVQALATRIEAHLLNLASDRQLAALRQKVQHEPTKPGERKPGLGDRGVDHGTPRWLGPVLVLFVLGALAGGAYYFRGDLLRMLAWLQTSGSQDAAAPTVPAPESAPPKPRRAARPPAEAQLPPTGPVGPASSAAAANSPWSRLRLEGEPAVQAPDAVQPAFATLDFAPPEPLTLDSLETPPPPDVTIYTQADEGVTPPRLVQPRLPSQPPPGVSEDQVGIIELLINEQGVVERVRLVSPSGRFNERMLLSALKAWVFEPARKDGRPVRYLTRVRITT